MKNKQIALLLTLCLLVPAFSTQAAKVQNVKVEADYDNLKLLWDQLSAEEYGDADGYALQWSKRESDVKITEPVTLYQDNNVDDISLRRNSFDNNSNYHVRIYTYKIDENNKKVLGNGSDRLKFKVNYNNQVESSTTVVTDPVIASSTGTTTDTSDFEFGVLRKYPYDTFADFSWSQPREMTSGDFDGFMIRISEDSGMADPVVSAAVDNDDSNIRITGLEADTLYYAQGHFYKDQGGEKKTFGDSAIRSFKTLAAVPRDSSTRQSRNIIKVERRAIRKIDAGQTSSDTTSSSTTSSSSSSSSTTSNSSTSTTTVNTSSQSTIDRADQTEVRRKIAELKRQIRSMETELSRWEAKLEGNTSTTTTTSSTSSRSTSGLSVRERLKLILESKRNR